MDMKQAAGLITSACASTSGSAKPVTTIRDVMKRPRSTAPEPSSVEKSSLPQCANTALGNGAMTKVSAVSHKH